MEKKSTDVKVCVTGGSGYIASWLVKKLLEKGCTVHATLRNLEDAAKVSLLKSLPGGNTNLVLFQADMNNPHEFEEAIQGCGFVFHVATPFHHEAPNLQFKDTVEVAVASVKSIADACIRSQTVKRLIFTASVTATSPLTEDGLKKYKSCMDETCWTPLDLSYIDAEEFMLKYTKSKTLAEKEILSYNDVSDGLEVVTLACGLVGGETLLSQVPLSVETTISQLTGKSFSFKGLTFLQDLLGSVPLVHIDDVCDAHIFCMEKPSLRGRFLCSFTNPTIREIATYWLENYPEYKIAEEFMGEEQKGVECDSSKLIKMGFKYKCDLKSILDDSVKCRRRLAALSLSSEFTVNQN